MIISDKKALFRGVNILTHFFTRNHPFAAETLIIYLPLVSVPVRLGGRVAVSSFTCHNAAPANKPKLFYFTKHIFFSMNVRFCSFHFNVINCYVQICSTTLVQSSMQCSCLFGVSFDFLFVIFFSALMYWFSKYIFPVMNA